ncbi:cellulose binding domain-containing protein [Actinomycetes bacterium KLBMP 9797]
MPGPDEPRRHRPLAARLDRHGRTMIVLTIVSVLLTAATMVASALDLIGPSQRAGARAAAAAPAYRDAGKPVPDRVADLLKRMSVEDKLGQLVQVDRATLSTPDDLATYRIGAVVAAVDPVPATELADRYDAVQRAAQAAPLAIPVLYGTDGTRGAATYPHQAGLAASGDPDLARRIGRATAEEFAGIGVDWALAARPDLVTGLQGARLDEPTSVLATARYAGPADREPLRAAIAQGVGAVVVPVKERAAATALIKGELRFPGFVATDRAGVAAIDGAPGVTGAEIAEAINAGVDMVAANNDPRGFVDLLRAEVYAGRVSTGRLDDANHRILTRKFELGLFERPLTDRGLTAAARDQAQRELARDAVRKSQVLLKNVRGALPLGKRGKIFVAGSGADDLGRQGVAGGTGTTVLRGIQAAVGTGATVTYRRDGAGINGSYRVAVAVITGDRGIDAADRATLARLRASGVPVVAVLLCTGPVDVAAQLGGWAALVAAWRPGSEGQGVADVLFGDHRPTGKLPAAWGKSFPAGFGLGYSGTPPTTGAPRVVASPTPRPTPTRRASSPPGPVPTTAAPAPTGPAPTPTAAVLACAVDYRVSSQWQTGFVAEVRITAEAAVDGWTVRFTFPGDQRITNAWNATVSQDGARVTATSLDWNRRVAAGGSVSFGFQATHGGTNASPPTATCTPS